MKVLFVGRIFNNTVGGIERVSTFLLNKLYEKNVKVSLFTWDKIKKKTFYPLNTNVEWKVLEYDDVNKKTNILKKLIRLYKMRKKIKQSSPDIIVAFQNGVFIYTALSMIGCSIPIIAAERESPYKFNYLKNSKNKRLFFNMLKFSQKIIIQFKRYRFGYPKKLGKKIISIPNPVILPALRAKLDVSKKKYHLLFVGRLTYQKNVESLIKAFLVLQQNHKHKNWILDIVGDGEDKKILKKFVIDNNLDKKVIFHNNSNNVEKFYLNSDLFCLPSRWEGFPNALSEALSYGLPAVGFEICAGVSDLIKNNYNGLLANSKKSDSDLSNKLDEMMSSKNKRALYGKRSRQLMKKYDPDIIVNKWIKCFREIYK